MNILKYVKDLKSLFYKPREVQKGWGKEIFLVNDFMKNVCGKILEFKKDTKMSSHSHYDKHEWFFCSKGKLKLILINPRTANKEEFEMTPGISIEIPPPLCHQLIALEDSEIIEISTYHSESDSYRVEKGDSQK